MAAVSLYGQVGRLLAAVIILLLSLGYVKPSRDLLAQATASSAAAAEASAGCGGQASAFSTAVAQANGDAAAKAFSTAVADASAARTCLPDVYKGIVGGGAQAKAVAQAMGKTYFKVPATTPVWNSVLASALSQATTEGQVDSAAQFLQLVLLSSGADTARAGARACNAVVQQSQCRTVRPVFARCVQLAGRSKVPTLARLVQQYEPARACFFPSCLDDDELGDDDTGMPGGDDETPDDDVAGGVDSRGRLHDDLDDFDDQEARACCIGSAPNTQACVWVKSYSQAGTTVWQAGDDGYCRC